MKNLLNFQNFSSKENYFQSFLQIGTILDLADEYILFNSYYQSIPQEQSLGNLAVKASSYSARTRSTHPQLK